MLDLGACLRYYKRSDVQKALVESAQDREISVRYLDGGFGKRPDVIINPSDVLESVRQKASSFHCSEEIWVNPLQIATGMKKEDLNRLRKGWDLVLDIDCPYWELSKITTWLFIEALKAHGIKSISLKFSGNKGFHIGVPFSAFPEYVPGKEMLTKDYFPEGPRRIASYLVDFITRNFIKVEDNRVAFGNKIMFTFDQLMQMTGKSIDELTYFEKNGKRIKARPEILKKEYHYECAMCGAKETRSTYSQYIKCKNENCGNNFVKPLETESASTDKADAKRKFDPLKIVEVDTILIAPRHLYRMVYSMHEKSGLVSIPIDPARILLFEKNEAAPENLAMSTIKFLDDSNTVRGEAEKLLKDSFDFNPQIETEEDEKKIKKVFGDFKEEITQKIPEELFPPCIKLLLQGQKDGRKRAMFILINFLSTVGWNHDEIKERLDAWNKLNAEQLRETLLHGHLSYHKINKKNVLPPNCPQSAQVQYYRDLQVCHPDSLCARIKNPVQYAKKRAWLVNREVSESKKKGRKKKEGKETSQKQKEKDTKESQNA